MNDNEIVPGFPGFILNCYKRLTMRLLIFKYLLIFNVFALGLYSCAESGETNEEEASNEIAAYIVDVTTSSMEFQAPDNCNYITLDLTNSDFLAMRRHMRRIQIYIYTYVTFVLLSKTYV